MRVLQQRSMGQQPSKEVARLREINAELSRAYELRSALLTPASEESAAGIPAVPGSAQARYQAVMDYLDRLYAEATAINACLGGY